MDWDEHIMLISHTVNVFRDNLLVIGNTGSNSTREALHATEQGFAVGMHASLQINPYYGKTSAPGLPFFIKCSSLVMPCSRMLSCLSTNWVLRQASGGEKLVCRGDRGLRRCGILHGFL